MIQRSLPTHVLFAAITLALAAAGDVGAQEIDWTANGRDVYGTRYSPASAITRDNVARLEVAWSYRTGETDSQFETAKEPSFEATPIFSEGKMYIGTPLGRVIALDAATGNELWVFDPGIRRDIRHGDFATRGVSMWVDEAAGVNAPCRRTIFAATAQSQLFAVDARDGTPCRAFGAGDHVVAFRLPRG